jgi:Domain of unknown function (DUF4386)
MFWANRNNKVAGVTILLIPLLSVVGFALGARTGDLDPFGRSDIEALLRAINDAPVAFALSMAPFVVSDMIVLVAAAALLYLTFRDRSHTLALTGAFAILVGVMALVVHEVSAMTLPFLAADLFSAGGPPGVASGDPIILESARTVSIVQGLAALCGQTAMGLGLAAFGILLKWAPEGASNPPRWLGVLGMFAGVGTVCTWLFLLDHTAGGVATLVAETATVSMLTILGVWLLRQRAPSSRKQ